MQSLQGEAMRITEVQDIDRVTVVREEDEQWPELATWSPNFVLRPDKLVIEFDNRKAGEDPAKEGLIHLAVSGRRIRLLKAGPADRGPGHMGFGPHNVPGPLHEIIRKVALDRLFVVLVEPPAPAGS
jgi:hypothetical protein